MIPKYNEQIRAKYAELDKDFHGRDCYVKPIRPGNYEPVGVSLENAARVIVDGAHRLATKQEVEDYLAAQELRRPIAAASDPLAAARRQFGLLKGES
jgi:hypothetical protein